jgi:hypothetical protein
MGETLRTETIICQPPKSRYLPVDFVDVARTIDGAAALMGWLRNHLPDAVKLEVNARKEFLPPLHEFGPTVRESYEHLLGEKAQDYSRLLWQYARYHNLLYLEHVNPDGGSEHERLTEARRKLHTPREKLIERKVGLRMALEVLGLINEANIIDYLFAEATAITSPARPLSVK